MMCEKAQEIQEYWKPKVLDYYCERENNKDKFIYYVRGVNEEIKYILRRNCIWLPMEGQLKEEYLDRMKPPEIIENAYKLFLEDLQNGNIDIKDSYRSDGKIIDLMFAMKILYGKRWSRKRQEWIKANNN